jgi:hypothetical protein
MLQSFLDSVNSVVKTSYESKTIFLTLLCFSLVTTFKGSDQREVRGAGKMANEMPWAMVNCDYNGAICIAATLYWWNGVSSTNSIGANVRKK